MTKQERPLAVRLSPKAKSALGFIMEEYKLPSRNFAINWAIIRGQLFAKMLEELETILPYAKVRELKDRFENYIKMPSD